ncbi:MAG: hypothetical protein ACRCWI_01410 [Brevinema sp.]
MKKSFLMLVVFLGACNTTTKTPQVQDLLTVDSAFNYVEGVIPKGFTAWQSHNETAIIGDPDWVRIYTYQKKYFTLAGYHNKFGQAITYVNYRNVKKLDTSTLIFKDILGNILTLPEAFELYQMKVYSYGNKKVQDPKLWYQSYRIEGDTLTMYTDIESADGKEFIISDDMIEYQKVLQYSIN